MNYFDRYKRINTPYGTTLSSHVLEASKQSALRSFLSSPTLSNVEVNGEESLSVVSVYQKDFYDRTFLFKPDAKEARVGNYIKHRGYTYLTLKSNDNDIYPNLLAKLCNEDFKLPTGKKRVKVSGRNGSFTYRDKYTFKHIPIVVDVKGYSIADNAILPLTEGRVIIYLRYEKDFLKYLNLNYEFEIFNDAYKITDIQLDKVIDHEGYIVLSAQKAVEVEHANKV